VTLENGDLKRHQHWRKNHQSPAPKRNKEKPRKKIYRRKVRKGVYSSKEREGDVAPGQDPEKETRLAVEERKRREYQII